jgi:FtsZ-binding cell division protein ZapB
MTTINTIEDLLRLLDENPQWVEALRARLLTRELMELPETFARFVETTTQALTALKEGQDRLREDVDALKEGQNSLREDVDALKEGQNSLREDVDALKEGQNSLREDVDTLKEGQDRLQEGQNRLQSDIQRIRDDVGMLKGNQARTATLREIGLLARALGLTIKKVLAPEEVASLAESSDTTDILPNDLNSFIRADFIIKASDQSRKPCYIAVEASFTVNGRDTHRAMRNAGYLTRFTGDPSHAVVSGVHIDDRVIGLTQSGEVFWYQLDPRSFGVE